MTDTTALSITELQQKAQEGDAQAQLDLVYRLEKGEGIEKNIELAFHWLKQAAEAGNAEAQYELGISKPLSTMQLLILNSINPFRWIDSNVNSDEAFSWILKSSEQNYAKAQYVAALCYFRGVDTQRNPELGVNWLMKAAENGLPDAQNYLAGLYYTGSYLELNKSLGFEWLEKAAISGLAEAQYELSNCYLNGDGVAQNYEQAYEWLIKFTGQEEGENYDNACMLLGDLCAEGKGIQQNDELAITWYERYAQKIQDSLADLREQKRLNSNDPSSLECLSTEESDCLKKQKEVKTRIGICCHRQATRSGLTSKQAYEWHKKAAENGHAESQYWLSRYYLGGEILEQPDKPGRHLDRYLEAVSLAVEAVDNGCFEANLIIGFILFFDIDRGLWAGTDRVQGIEAFKAAIGHGKQGIAEYFLAEYYCHSSDENERKRAEHYAEQSDLEKVWQYFDIDKLLEIDNSLRDKIQVLLKDRELQKLTEKQLRLEIRALEMERETERKMLSFFTHTMLNALATAPESLRQAIQLLGGDVYEKDTKHYQAINKIASLFSALTLTDCLIDTFKQSISDPQEFKYAWENDYTGDATPSWVIAASLRQSLSRIFFMGDASDLKKLLSDTQKTAIKAARKSFIDEILPLDIDNQGVEFLYSWISHHVQSIDISIADADGLKFGANKTRFSLLFAITSELILNALKYWDSEDKIQIGWKLADSGYFVFSVKNHCKPNAASNLAGTHNGLAFIKRLIELLGEQASFTCKVENGFFVAELMLNKTLFGDE